MIGVIYTDAGTDKLVTNIEGVFNCAVHTTINDRNNVLDVTTPTGLEFFRSAFFTSRNVLLFRLVTVTVVADDHFDISETESFTLEEEVAFISADDLNIIAYRAATYQAVLVSSLLINELIDIGSLSFADMQTVMTQAATLTSPQIKYITPIHNDNISFTEL